ncbi:hypothetical protein B0T16DRAFT_443128 [Cercophora newfieldiana]|uniref:Uncharacterized protein n=1 Tax=Cercophora newfieldiana TaxID=92897 RepID=A0AA40CV67_9PEZI|nr:hypothetical protein B0T16DRAFT_443128 [Cercophora newfieldiana]
MSSYYLSMPLNADANANASNANANTPLPLVDWEFGDAPLGSTGLLGAPWAENTGENASGSVPVDEEAGVNTGNPDGLIDLLQGNPFTNADATPVGLFVDPADLLRGYEEREAFRLLAAATAAEDGENAFGALDVDEYAAAAAAAAPAPAIAGPPEEPGVNAEWQGLQTGNSLDDEGEIVFLGSQVRTQVGPAPALAANIADVDNSGLNVGDIAGPVPALGAPARRRPVGRPRGSKNRSPAEREEAKAKAERAKKERQEGRQQKKAERVGLKRRGKARATVPGYNAPAPAPAQAQAQAPAAYFAPARLAAPAAYFAPAPLAVPAQHFVPARAAPQPPPPQIDLDGEGVGGFVDWVAPGAAGLGPGLLSPPLEGPQLPPERPTALLGGWRYGVLR